MPVSTRDAVPKGAQIFARGAGFPRIKKKDEGFPENGKKKRYSECEVCRDHPRANDAEYAQSFLRIAFDRLGKGFKPLA
jgi:hypothetical protein